MKLNLKERGIIIYTLLWKYDSFKNLQLKELIESKIKFSTEEENNIRQYDDGTGATITEFNSNLDLETETEYPLTEEEIIYLAGKIMFINQNNRLDANGMSLYTKIENVYAQILAEQDCVRIGPWEYLPREQYEKTHNIDNNG